MSARIQNAALFFAAATAVSLLGCASIIAPEAPDAPEAPEEELTEEAEDLGVTAWGAVRAYEAGPGLAGAVVCDFYDHSLCDTSDEDGVFEIEGLQAGAMGLLSIRHDRRAPTLVPVDLDHVTNFIELSLPASSMHQQLLKAGDVTNPEGDGAVRFQMWRSNGYAPYLMRDVTWTPETGEATTVSTLDLPGTGRRMPEQWAVGLGGGMRAFRWNAPGSMLCSRRAGWRGDGYGVVVVPVLQGWVTHVEQVCVEVVP